MHWEYVDRPLQLETADHQSTWCLVDAGRIRLVRRSQVILPGELTRQPEDKGLKSKTGAEEKQLFRDDILDTRSSSVRRCGFEDRKEAASGPSWNRAGRRQSMDLPTIFTPNHLEACFEALRRFV